MSRDESIRDAVDRFLAAARQDLDARLHGLAADLLRIVEGDALGSRVELERAAIEVARAVGRGGDHARHDLVARIASAVRRLDEATTLRGILDALADGAAGEASRVAVMLVDGAWLRRYRDRGFGPGLDPVDVALASAPLLAGVIDVRQATKVPSIGDRADGRLPAFMRVPAGHVGQVIPLVIGQEVVAVVYVEGPDRSGAQAGEPVWAEQVEVLVSHASARLESVTSRRTVEVLTGPSQ